jgi:hypothetical protein
MGEKAAFCPLISKDTPRQDTVSITWTHVTLRELFSNLPVAGAKAKHEDAIAASVAAIKKFRNIILSLFRQFSTTVRTRMAIANQESRSPVMSIENLSSYQRPSLNTYFHLQRN